MSFSLIKSSANRESDSNETSNDRLPLVMDGCRPVRSGTYRVTSFLRRLSAMNTNVHQLHLALARIAQCVTAIAIAALASDPNVTIAIRVFA
jgi:hypothetical protein